MLSFEATKAAFFDREKIDKALDKPVRQVLSKFGAFVRKDARDSIKKAPRTRVGELEAKAKKAYRQRQKIAKKKGWKKPTLPFKPSEPGKPPRTRRANSGLKKILFYYDKKTRSVGIGPIGGASRGKTTSVLEKGGSDKARWYKTTWKRTATGKRKRVRKKMSKRVRIAARPFMNPAMNKNLALLREWRSAIKG